MFDSDLIHVIPPYLLNSCLGQDLYEELFWLDPELASRNAFSPKSTIYRFRRPSDIPEDSNTFCQDPHINELIKGRIKEKFSVMGILGNSTPEHVSDEYLYELYEEFKHRLLSGDSKKGETAKSSNGNGVVRSEQPLGTSSGSSSTSSESSSAPKKSIFEIPRYGEFIYSAKSRKNISVPSDSYPLDVLMAWAQETKENKYSFLPHLMIHERKSFLTPLPMFWSPLCSDKHLKLLEDTFAMQSDLNEGYSVLTFKLQQGAEQDHDDKHRKKQFFNFVANNEVPERSGVFYYEVSVEQIATQASDFRPIIHANDPSLSSSSSLFFNMGFAKRNIRIDKSPVGSNASSSTESTLDLKAIQNDLLAYNLTGASKVLDEETINFLASEPGVNFEGSLAISFNNSCSYASTKKVDSSQRASSLNLNRRFSQLNRQAPGESEPSKLDVDAPFSTHTIPDAGDRRYLKTDTVGFGVNFVDRTLFITLNGILVKTISDEEIASSNRHQDSIFERGSNPGPLIPIIGFQLTELSQVSDGDMPESKIITNFGLREFQFNINNYVKTVKAKQNELLKSCINEEIQVIRESNYTDKNLADFEKAVFGMKDDPAMLNDFIKGHLVQEGYLETFHSFKCDLDDLYRSTSKNQDSQMEEEEESKQMEKIFDLSLAKKRRKLQEFISNSNFRSAIEYLAQEFPGLPNIEIFIFELRVSQYIDMLKKIVENKFSDANDEKSRTSAQEEQSFKEAYELGHLLLEQCKDSTSTYEMLSELSSVFLITCRSDIEDLPQVKYLFGRHANDISILSNAINLEILSTQNFSKDSRLETMVESVSQNINKLSSEQDTPFKLVNYEKDYLDI